MAVGVAAHGADLGSEGAGSAFGKHRGVVVLNRGEQGDDSSRGPRRAAKLGCGACDRRALFPAAALGRAAGD